MAYNLVGFRRKACRILAEDAVTKRPHLLRNGWPYPTGFSLGTSELTRGVWEGLHFLTPSWKMVSPLTSDSTKSRESYDQPLKYLSIITINRPPQILFSLVDIRKRVFNGI